MCTAIKLQSGLFGRTLDYETSFGEEVLLTPREQVTFGESKNRYAMLGVGVMRDGIPLYFDGMNEWGLCAAALNFKGYAVYHTPTKGEASVPCGSVVGLILGYCRNTDEARGALGRLTIRSEGESAPLHWMICDRRGAIVVESVEDGLKIYDNPIGVLTNAPDFSYHMTRIKDFHYLSASNHSGDGYSRGMGGMGLPGDFSSSSRFVRAAFLCRVCEGKSVGDFFKIADNLSIPKGAVITDEGRAVETLYTCCCDPESLSYYFTCRTDRKISCVKLTDSLRDGRKIVSYPLYHDEKIHSL